MDPRVQPEGCLFVLPVLEVEKGLYVEVETGHTTDNNNYWSFNASLSFSFHLCKAITDNSCDPNFSFHAWILQHFLHIFGWASIETYTKDIPCAIVFPLLRWNQTTKPFRVYFDHLVSEDMHFNNYVDHCQTRQFDEIMLCFGWLASGSRLIAPHLSKHVMRKFGYT